MKSLLCLFLFVHAACLQFISMHIREKLCSISMFNTSMEVVKIIPATRFFYEHGRIKIYEHTNMTTSFHYILKIRYFGSILTQFIHQMIKLLVVWSPLWLCGVSRVMQ